RAAGRAARRHQCERRQEHPRQVQPQRDRRRRSRRRRAEDREGGEGVINTLLMYASIAFGLTVLLIALLWCVEIVLGRQIGVFLSWASVVLVALFVAYAIYAELKQPRQHSPKIGRAH